MNLEQKELPGTMISEVELRMALNKEYVLGEDERKFFQNYFINYLDDHFDRYSCRVTHDYDPTFYSNVVIGVAVYYDHEWYTVDVLFDEGLFTLYNFRKHLSRLIEKLNRAIRNKDHT